MSRIVTKKRPLTRAVVLRAALDVLDREGLDALTMRRVATALHVEAMSLYRHVEHKAALLDGIVELILEEVSRASSQAEWQARLKAEVQGFRKALRAHPHAMPLFALRPAVTLASLARIDAILDVMRHAGLSASDALGGFHALVAFTVGHTLSSYGTDPRGAEGEPDYEEASRSLPRIRELVALLPSYEIEKEFERGVDDLLFGLARRAHAPRA
jgi:AcrR family transcriptional regulator